MFRPWEDNHQQDNTSASRTYEVVKNEVLYSGINQYEVLEFLGSGSFGKVVKCCNERTKEVVAIKILESDPSQNILGQNEFRLLCRLRQEGCDEIVKAFECFTHKKHTCIVFEILEISLFGYLKETDFKSLPIEGIRQILEQVLTALVKLKQLGLIHMDLKPENIMLVDPVRQPWRVKVIDFGCAVHVTDSRRGTYCQTRYYRSPEVILGLPFSEAIDMWSLGCIVAELFLGVPLYPGRTEYDQIRYITETQGLPTVEMMLRASKKYFVTVSGRWRLMTSGEYEKDTGVKSAESPRYGFKSIDDIGSVLPNISASDSASFTSLLRKMLEYDQVKRISPQDALDHRFVVPLKSKKRARDDISPIKTKRFKPCSSSDLNGQELKPLNVGLPVSTLCPPCWCGHYHGQTIPEEVTAVSCGTPGVPSEVSGIPWVSRVPWGVPGVPWGVPGVPWGVLGVPLGVPGFSWGIPGVPWGNQGGTWGVPGVPWEVAGLSWGFPGVPSGVLTLPSGVPALPSGVPALPSGISGHPLGVPRAGW